MRQPSTIAIAETYRAFAATLPIDNATRQALLRREKLEALLLEVVDAVVILGPEAARREIEELLRPPTSRLAAVHLRLVR